MKPRTRSIGGGLMMLAIIPVIVGLLACMKVPIGNPERSRIDPELSGLWTLQDPDGDMGGIILLDPYDKRTWLGMMVEPHMQKTATTDKYDDYTYEGLVAAMQEQSIQSPLVTADEVALYKIWLTKLGGEQFMVWQPKGFYDDGEFGAEYAYNWHITKHSESSFDLRMIDPDHPAFEGVDQKNRKALERVIRKHASDAGLYGEEVFAFKRVDPEHADLLGDLIYDLLVVE